MSKPATEQQLIERIAALSVELYGAHHAVKCLREELHDEYQQYVRNHGEPDPSRRGVDHNNPAYAGLIRYTAEAYTRLQKGKRQRYNVKRRLDTAVRALMIQTGQVLVAPKPAAVKRSNAAGETLQ